LGAKGNIAIDKNRQISYLFRKLVDRKQQNLEVNMSSRRSHKGVWNSGPPCDITFASFDLHNTLVVPTEGRSQSLLVKQQAEIVHGDVIAESHLEIARRTKIYRLFLDERLPPEQRSGPGYWMMVNKHIFGFCEQKAIELSYRLTTNAALYEMTAKRRAFFKWLFDVKFPASEIILAIVSNSDLRTVVALLEKIGMGGYFEIENIFTPERYGGRGKQSPGFFGRVLKEKKVKPGEAVHFGNSSFYDLWAALAKMFVVWLRDRDESIYSNQLRRKLGASAMRLILPVDRLQDARRLVDAQFVRKQ
jgi:FMN phosphatase YigB (HAD superfamily)